MADPLSDLLGDQSIPVGIFENARALLRLAPTALQAERGKLPTIRLFWPTPKGTIEVEVFDESLEIWPDLPRSIEVWEEDFVAGEVMPPRLAALLLTPAGPAGR